MWYRAEKMRKQAEQMWNRGWGGGRCGNGQKKCRIGQKICGNEQKICGISKKKIRKRAEKIRERAEKMRNWTEKMSNLNKSGIRQKKNNEESDLKKKVEPNFKKKSRNRTTWNQAEKKKTDCKNTETNRNLL